MTPTAALLLALILYALFLTGAFLSVASGRWSSWSDDPQPEDHRDPDAPVELRLVEYDPREHPVLEAPSTLGGS